MFKCNLGQFKVNSGVAQAWRHLVRKIQTTIEATFVYNYNGTNADFLQGHMVYLDGHGNRHVNLAFADTEAHSDWMGVMLEDVAEPGVGEDPVIGVAATDNVKFILFEAALDPAPAAGDRVWLSQATAGVVTNVEPVAGFIVPVGIVVDGSEYATRVGCRVLFKCCLVPEEVQA